MPTRLRRRTRRAVEPLEFGLLFCLASRLDGPSWIWYGGRRIAPVEAVRLAELHLAEVLEVWLWSAGDRLPWAVREALGSRCPASRRGVEALLARYGMAFPGAAR